MKQAAGVLTFLVVSVSATVAAAATITVGVGCNAQTGQCDSEFAGFTPPTIHGISGVAGQLVLAPFDPALGTLDTVELEMGFVGGGGFYSPTNAGTVGVDIQLASTDGETVATFARPLGVSACNGPPGPDGLYHCFDSDTFGQRRLLDPKYFQVLGEPLTVTYNFNFYAPGGAIDSSGGISSLRFASQYRFTPAAAVPEPTAALLYAGGLAVFAASRRRTR